MAFNVNQEIRVHCTVDHVASTIQQPLPTGALRGPNANGPDAVAVAFSPGAQLGPAAPPAPAALAPPPPRCCPAEAVMAHVGSRTVSGHACGGLDARVSVLRQPGWQGRADIARHVIGCQFKQETRAQHACRRRDEQHLAGPTRR